MDNKQINMLEQYYNTPARRYVYCKECGCAVDMYAEQETENHVKKNKLKLFIVILLIALAITSIALIICAHIISELKKSQSYNSVYISKPNNEICYYMRNKSL